MSKIHLSRKYWELNSEHDHYHYLIGRDYGDTPLAKKDEIQKDKAYVADMLKSILGLNSSKTGLEIGSGCGHVTYQLSKYVGHVYGVDISSTYIELARQTCALRDNVSFHVVEPGSLAFVRDGTLDFVYSNNVFIHLDIYEIVHYLRECARVLKRGGQLWFDIADLDRVDFLVDSDFLNTVSTRQVDPINKNCIQYVSAPTAPWFSVPKRT